MDQGVNFLDTANIYNQGRGEEITGQALLGIRHNVVLATMVGMQMSENVNDGGVSRFHIVRSVEASLRRLQTDYVDSLYIHWPTEAIAWVRSHGADCGYQSYGATRGQAEGLFLGTHGRGVGRDRPPVPNGGLGRVRGQVSGLATLLRHRLAAKIAVGCI